MIAWFVRNPIAANCMMLLILTAGLYTAMHFVQVEPAPLGERGEMSVTISLPGATPEEIEVAVSSIVEAGVADLPFVESVRSRSTEALSTVTIKLKSGTDSQKALIKVTSRVEALTNLPKGIERPVVSIQTNNNRVLKVLVSGDLDSHELAYLAHRIRNDWLRLGIVSNAEVGGIGNYQIQINVANRVLREYGLSRAAIASAIRQQAIDLAAGQLRTDDGDIIIHSNQRAYRHNDFHKIVIQRFDDGSTLQLGDIAEIVDGFDESTTVMRYNGKPAASIEINNPSESAIQISQAVRTYLADLRRELPASVQISVFDDDAQRVSKPLAILLLSGAQGAILVMILLSLFLHPSVALWVAAGVPVCFAGALALFPILGLTLNTMSLFSFVLVLGVVVDDAIVTGENIYAHHARGQRGERAAIEGTREITVPVVFGVITTMLAFFPLLHLPASVSHFGIAIGAPVIAVLCFSLVESKLILPAHLRRLNISRSSSGPWFTVLKHGRRMSSVLLNRMLQSAYLPLLSECARQRYVTVLGFTCVLILLLSLVALGWIRTGFFPERGSDKIAVSVKFEPGAPVRQVEAVVAQLESAALRLQKEYQSDEAGGTNLIGNIYSDLSTPAHFGSSFGMVFVAINQNADIHSEVTPTTLVNRWRELSGDIARVEEVQFLSSHADFMASMPTELRLQSNNHHQLIQAVAQVKRLLGEFQDVYDITDSIHRGKPTLLIELKPTASLLGLDQQAVTMQVREAFFGVQAQRIQRGQDDVRVMVMAPAHERDEPGDLDNLLIRTPSGAEVLFRDIARVSPGLSSAIIDRVDQWRVATVSARINRDTVNSKAFEAAIETGLDTIMRSYPDVSYTWGSGSEIEKKTVSAMKFGLFGVLITIFALLAIVFKSWMQPFIIILVIPYALIGALIGHLIMGLSLSMYSMFGMFALVGVVINDSLVLVDWINRRIRDGVALKDAVHSAGAARFRAVILTSLTTFVGLLPMLFITEPDAFVLVPMAASLGFGIVFATFSTLLLVPCSYLIMRDIQGLFRRCKGKQQNSVPV